MEAKLVLLSGARILLQSWGQAKDGRWQPADEWITIEDYKQAPNYPNTVAGLLEIKKAQSELKKKAKLPPLPPKSELFEDHPITDGSIPF